MDLKKIPAEETTITRDNNALDSQTGNIYKAIAVIGKRANQIGVTLKKELDDKLLEFSSNIDNLEEVFENREQIEISKYYERLPKPSAMAIEEYLTEKIYHKKPEVVSETVTDQPAAIS